MLRAIPATLMRGGTSKGLFFHAADLPADTATRDRVLLAAMGSPDTRQIDGVGGAHPLTSKVAILSASDHPDADVDYLFLQVVVDKAEVSDSQPCGNILAAVGPWSLENGLLPAHDGVTPVRIRTVNNGAVAIAHVLTPGGRAAYEGDASIDGVPGTAAPITLEFLDVAGSNCGALLPTGAVINTVSGIDVTCIDNGMPVVLLRAEDFGLSGAESPSALENNAELKAKIEDIRLKIGPKMNLGDVSKKTVPKMTLISAPLRGGALSTRSFIPHRVHDAIGVLGAVSVATAVVLKGSVASHLYCRAGATGRHQLDIEHPTGFFTVELEVEAVDGTLAIRRSALLRTARLLMRGEVYIPSATWSGS
ncbi:MAG TPA: 4-oxalomesaconate tautomerase [Parvularcula sp.]|nr:4-oxalomesaconate tautomerase [Parvularcula sp.]HBS36625.1 4-oxalomesaconate tautomerase [Parvularcula sp.]